MPMVDVTAPVGLIPSAKHAELGTGLAAAVLRAEGVPVADPYASNTATFIHELPASAIHTAAEAQTGGVRVTVITPPGALDRDAQRHLVDEATRLVVEAAGVPELAGRTWVILREAAEGGWGVGGQALGRAEFAALAAAAAQ